jgi:hypothetical protein
MSRAARREWLYWNINKKKIKENEREIGCQVESGNWKHRKWRTGKSVLDFRLTPKPSL